MYIFFLFSLVFFPTVRCVFFFFRFFSSFPSFTSHMFTSYREEAKK